jgi:hypothetical protein
MVVTRRPILGGTRVDLVGPAGHIALEFSRPDDLGFIALWQRWRHPRPRPELADQL